MTNTGKLTKYGRINSVIGIYADWPELGQELMYDLPNDEVKILVARLEKIMAKKGVSINDQ